MADYSVVFVPGRAYWAKIVGDAALHDNYDKDGKEWSWEFCPDDPAFLKDHRLLGRLKAPNDEKNPDKGDYLYLKKPELDKDGNKNDPIAIVDFEGNDWDGKTLIGNGSKVVAKLAIVNWGGGKQKSIWTTATRVDELVPYEGGGERTANNDFSGYDGSKPKAKKEKAPAKAAPALDDLDDDLPF